MADDKDKQPDRECPFRISDLVRHRASGERGIVVAVGRRCVFHTPLEHAALTMGRIGRPKSSDLTTDECVYAYNGEVTLSVGLAADPVDIEDYLLEAVKTDEQEA